MMFPKQISIVLLVILLCSGCSYSLFSAGGDDRSAQKSLASNPKPSTSLAAKAFSLSSEPRILQTSTENTTNYSAVYRGQMLIEDVTWHGKVLVRGIVTIAPQATLTIGSGTEVIFVSDTDRSTAGALLIRGRLIVLGTAERPVRISSNSSQTKPGLWQGIVLLGSGKNNIFDHAIIEGAVTGIESISSTVSLKETTIAYCSTGARFQESLVRASSGVISSCVIGNTLIDSEADLRSITYRDNDTALVLYGGSLYLKSAEFSRNSDGALQAEHARLQVSRSRFVKNRTGLTVSESEGTVELSDILENFEYGVFLKQSRIKVTDNHISRNTGVGITVEGGRSYAWGNTISYNGLYDLYNAGTEDFRAIGNWWQTTKVEDIRKRIFDRSDDSKRGAVLISPVLSKAPDVGSKSFPRIVK